MTTTQQAALELPQDLASVGDARHFVRDRFDAWGFADLLDVAYLVVSELAANAITHAGSAYLVALSAEDRRVRIAVTDHGPGIPAEGPHQLVTEHGRGLMLVAAMSADWGVVPTADGKVVWADLELGAD